MCIYQRLVAHRPSFVVCQARGSLGELSPPMKLKPCHISRNAQMNLLAIRKLSLQVLYEQYGLG